MKLDGAPWAPGEGGMRPLDASLSVSMNIWGLPAAFIDYLAEGFVPFLERMGENALSAEYLLPNAVGEMIRAGRGSVRVLPTQEHWFGMTYAEERLLAQQRIRELIAGGRYPERL